MSGQPNDGTTTTRGEADDAGATSQEFGNLSVEDDAHGTVDAAVLAGTGEEALGDIGPRPTAFDLETATTENANYRTVVWSGAHLQVTLMSIPVGESIGLEMHPGTDQFLRLDAGRGKARMGTDRDQLTFEQDVTDGWCVLVPAGAWHDVTNTGDEPLRLYTVYAPVHHANGTIQATAADAEQDEEAGTDEPPAWSVQPPQAGPDQHAG